MLSELSLISNNPFMPHGYCYLWKPNLVALHIVSDSMIGLAYYVIPPTLIYFVRKREDLVFNWIFLLFGAFIIACGTTHFIEVWTLWHPNYWFSGAVKLLTAIISVYTAIRLFPLIPQALELPSPKQIEIANQQLKELNQELTEIKQDLEQRVESRTSELTDAVNKLEQEIIRRQQIEEALQENSARFRRIFDSNMIGILFWKIGGEVLEVNDAFLKILGYSRNDLLIKELSWLEFTPPEYLSLDKKALDEIAETGVATPYEKEVIRSDGSRVPILIGGSRLEGLTDTGVCFVLDISQRKEYERKLRQWADIFQHTGQGLVVNSPGSEVLEIINPAFAAMHGYTVEELSGCSLSTVLAPSALPSFPEHFRLAMVNDRYMLENLHIRKDGTIFPVFIDATNVKDHTGKTLYIILNFQDITARKQAETEIINALNREKELNELKSRFITLTSHEFRTPLATILSSAELLKYYSHKLPESEKTSLFGQIETATTRMTGLLDDILTINKSESGKLELNPTAVDLQKFCSEVVNEIKLSTGNNYEIVFTNTGECTNAVMDEKNLLHILTNLLGNAIKYSPNGGIVELLLTCQNLQAIFQVKDYGIGIPEESQEKLFESFHRASNVGNIQGTGLGLSIVKRMVDLSGGEITFNSEVGVGTTFTVILPLNVASSVSF